MHTFTPEQDEHEDWRHRAACRDEDPDRMTPEEATPEEVQSALRLCQRCPVLDECAALRRKHQAYGVWAGKWWGDPPLNPAETRCGWCGSSTGSPRAAYCSSSCKNHAYRARRALSA